MRAAQGLGESQPHGEAEGDETPLHLGEHGNRAAEEMWNAGEVEPKTIVTVNIQGWAEAAAPAGQSKQRGSIFRRCCWSGDEMRTDGARIGKTATRQEPDGGTARIHRGEHKPAILAADKGKRPVSR